jgi:hypothetical protein
MPARLTVLNAESAQSALEREGWTRRFVAAPPRLQEMSELYAALGLEVRHEPLGEADLRVECGDCVLAQAVFRIIYTREMP